jgi:hypothetical protein
MSKFTAPLRALAKTNAGKPVTVEQLADVLGIDREKAVSAASGLMRRGYLEAGPERCTYHVAVELLPEPRRPAKRRGNPAKPTAKLVTRDSQRIDPTAHQTPDVLAQDFPILDVLDLHGPLSTRDVRRLIQSSFNVSPSLERLRMAGLVRLDGLRWVAV